MGRGSLHLIAIVGQWLGNGNWYRERREGEGERERGNEWEREWRRVYMRKSKLHVFT